MANKRKRRLVTDHEREQVADHLNAGNSVNATAKKFNRSTSTISKIAREAGIDVSANAHSRLARAHEARRAYGAEARASTAAAMHERVDKILAKLDAPHIVFNIGGRDNVYTEHQLDAPDAKTLRDYASVMRDLMRTVLDIDRHDNRAAEVDQAAGLIVDLVDQLRGGPDG